MGDVFLALLQKSAFMLGLISFLGGHVMYVLAFLPLVFNGIFLWGGILVFLIISVYVFFWLNPHLGTMRGPVLIYIIVITAMVSCGAGVFGNFDIRLPGRLMIFAGAILFYLSDVFVARDRFVKKEYFNRLVGLPTYYAGPVFVGLLTGASSNKLAVSELFSIWR